MDNRILNSSSWQRIGCASSLYFNNPWMTTKRYVYASVCFNNLSDPSPNTTSSLGVRTVKNFQVEVCPSSVQIQRMNNFDTTTYPIYLISLVYCPQGYTVSALEPLLANPVQGDNPQTFTGVPFNVGYSYSSQPFVITQTIVNMFSFRMYSSKQVNLYSGDQILVIIQPLIRNDPNNARTELEQFGIFVSYDLKVN